MAAPAPSGRSAQAVRRTGRSLGGLNNASSGSRHLARPLAHLLILSIVLAALPTPRELREPDAAWVEDVGGFDLGEAWPETTLPLLAVDALPPGAASSEQEAPPLLSPRYPLKLAAYEVEDGDTLSTVASRFGINVDTVLWANDLADPDILVSGTKLLIPPLPGVLHRVRPGDTVADLSSYYKADFQRVIDVNALEAPFTILVGQRLLLPDGRMPPRSAEKSDPAPVVDPPAPQTDKPPSKPAPQRDAAPGRAASVLASSIAIPATAPRPLPRPTGASGEQAQFILAAAEAARISQRATGIPASVTIAQAILESFWGSSRLSRENNNYFGIKAKERPGSAGVIWYDTWEVEGGRSVVQREPFRAYNTMADSFVDHGQFFHQNSRYAGALAARGDARQFAREINRAGYATDPSYAPKLIGLMDRFDLYAYDDP